jgi:hypothetical protein
MNLEKMKRVFFEAKEREGNYRLIETLLLTRVGQGGYWLPDVHKPRNKEPDLYAYGPQDGPITKAQRIKWYRVGEYLMRGNAFHLAVLVGDSEIFAFLMDELRLCVHVYNV